MEEPRPEMLESFSAFQTLSSLQKQCFFQKMQPGSVGEGLQSAGPGLGSELRIMWQRLSKLFFADLGNLKEPLPFFLQGGCREAVLGVQ